ncbi:serine hydrolase domain-containing protein [Nocardioides korecus]
MSGASARVTGRGHHFQAVLDRYQAERRLPTLAAGVLDAGRLTWAGAAGEQVDPDTRFRIGSITKTVTAVLVLQCRDEGLLSLEDPVGRFLPETGYADRTLRSLLAHVGGLQSEPAGPWWERSPGGGVEDLLAGNDGSLAVAGPGEFWHYSNLAYGLLGEVVARLRGESWRSLVQTRVLDPLGMTQTSCTPTAPAAAGWSVDHLRGTLTSEPAHDTGAMAPAGQLWSTLGDLAQLAAFLVQGDPAVLPAATLREMRQPVEPALDYGLGVRLVPWSDGVLVGHTGSMPGFQAVCLVDALSGVGVVALTNATTGFSGDELALALLGTHTPGPTRAWTPTPAGGVSAWAEELLGTWFWGNSAFEARWSDGHLELRDLARGAVVAERFAEGTPAHAGRRVVGVAGYHRGEELHVVRRGDGAVDHLECATFVYTRTPYPDGA